MQSRADHATTAHTLVKPDGAHRIIADHRRDWTPAHHERTIPSNRLAQIPTPAPWKQAMPSIDDLQRKARELAPEAFKRLAKVAETGIPRDRAMAQASLRRRLPLLRELCDDASLSPEDRRDLQAILKKFAE